MSEFNPVLEAPPCAKHPNMKCPPACEYGLAPAARCDRDARAGRVISATAKPSPGSIPVREALLMRLGTAVDHEMQRQYRDNPQWEDAKEVVENVDCCEIARVVLIAIMGWESQP